MIHTQVEATVSSKVDVSPTSIKKSSETFFSTLDFAQAWSISLGGDYRTIALPVRGSGPPRTMYGIEFAGSYGRRSILLGPYGVYASPGWGRLLEQSTLKNLVASLTTVRTESFVWNVRFDHAPLAEGLSSLGLKSQQTVTHILQLDSDYDRIFSGYNATRRNEVRRAYRSGVVVREAIGPQCVREYYRIHTSLAEQKGNYKSVYPAELFLELHKIRDYTRFLVAEYEGRIIAGGLFFRDGDSVMYWHAASDRDFSRQYPSCAVLDHAIRWACESGATFFNFGGSGGIPSLEQFKSSWGAGAESNWMFEWKNPFWRQVSNLKARLVHPTDDEANTFS